MTGSARAQSPYRGLKSDEIKILRLLAKPGVVVVVSHAQNGVLDVLRRRFGSENKIADCAQPIWTKISGLGLVEAACARGEWRISPLGVAVLKHARAQSRSRCAPRKPNSTSPTSPPKPDINAQESPLVWLSQRRGRDGKALISDVQLQAGERLRKDFSLANLSQRVTMDWSLMLGAPGHSIGSAIDRLTMSETAQSAHCRVQKALQSVGPELAGVLVDVCCFLKGLETLEADAGWPRRSGKVILQLALTSLARHYGLIVFEQNLGETRRASVRHWGQTDFKPHHDASAG